MSRRLAAFGVGLAAVCAGSTSWAGNARIYVRPGTTAQDVAQALLACKQDVGELASPGFPNVHVQEVDAKGRVGPPSAPTAVGGVIGSAIVQAFVDSAYRRSAVPGCMRARGFARVQLSDQEQRTYKGLTGHGAKAEWENKFIKDVTPTAFAEAMKPKATPLPIARDEPFVVGPVRLDPQKVKVVASPINAGGALFVTDGFYRQTARVASQTQLATLYALGKSYPLVVQAGAVYQQTYEGHPKVLGQWEDKTVWCGPAELRGKPITVCFRSTFEGYQFAQTGPDWFPAVTPLLELNNPLGPASLVLEELPVDLTGTSPFQVALKVDRVSTKAAQLRAVAIRGKEEIPFWAGTAAFDDSGRAIMPFWTQRLILARAGRGVSATMEEGGDGTGWR